MPYNGITFRAISSEDRAILYNIYASTRIEEIARLNWSKKQKDEFLHMQFTAQHSYYQNQFTRADFNLILNDKQVIGRLYLDRREDEFRIIDIALLPSHRNKGIGKALMEDILAEAKMAEKPVRIHVEKQNPALNLYNRLGFTQIGDTEVYYLMEWIAE